MLSSCVWLVLWWVLSGGLGMSSNYRSWAPGGAVMAASGSLICDQSCFSQGGPFPPFSRVALSASQEGCTNETMRWLPSGGLGMSSNYRSWAPGVAVMAASGTLTCEQSCYSQGGPFHTFRRVAHSATQEGCTNETMRWLPSGGLGMSSKERWQGWKGTTLLHTRYTT